MITHKKAFEHSLPVGRGDDGRKEIILHLTLTTPDCPNLLRQRCIQVFLIQVKEKRNPDVFMWSKVKGCVVAMWGPRGFPYSVAALTLHH